jgi:hypothetical protein
MLASLLRAFESGLYPVRPLLSAIAGNPQHSSAPLNSGGTTSSAAIATRPTTTPSWAIRVIEFERFVTVDLLQSKNP